MVINKRARIAIMLLKLKLTLFPTLVDVFGPKVGMEVIAVAVREMLDKQMLYEE